MKLELSGLTVLVLAAKMGKDALVKMILDRSPSSGLFDRGGPSNHMQALVVAIEEQHVAVVKTLVEHEQFSLDGLG